MENQVREVTKRELNIYYNVDMLPISKLMSIFNITFDEVKACLRAYGFTVRSGEVRPNEEKPTYEVFLKDLNKNLSDLPKVERKKKAEATA